MYPVFGSAQVWGSEERESLWKSVPFFRLVWSMIFPPLSHALGPYSRFSKSWDAFLGRLFETFTDSFSLVLVFCTPQVVVGCAYTWHLSGGLGFILSNFISSPLCIYKPLSRLQAFINTLKRLSLLASPLAHLWPEKIRDLNSFECSLIYFRASSVNSLECILCIC